MNIVGVIDPITGLGFVNAYLISIRRDIRAPVHFLIDTGSSTTTIGLVDTLRIGINYSDLPKSKKIVVTGAGEVTPHVLDGCEILFDLGETMLVESVGDVNIIITTPTSILGIDVLKKFSVRYHTESVILER